MKVEIFSPLSGKNRNFDFPTVDNADLLDSVIHDSFIIKNCKVIKSLHLIIKIQREAFGMVWYHKNGDKKRSVHQLTKSMNITLLKRLAQPQTYHLSVIQRSTHACNKCQS